MAGGQAGGGSNGVLVRELVDVNPAYVRRSIGQRSLSKLIESMDKEGLRYPILVRSDYVIIDGARRLEAAKALGWERVWTVATSNFQEVVRLLEAAHRDEFHIPWRWLEVADFKQNVMHPVELMDRIEIRRQTRAGKPPATPRERVRRLAAAIGLSSVHYEDMGRLASYVRRTRENLGREEAERVIAVIEQYEQMGWAPGSARTRLGRDMPLSPPGEKKPIEAPPLVTIGKTAKEQTSIAENTITILRVLGADLRNAFTPVSTQLSVEAAKDLADRLNKAHEPIRRTQAILRRYVAAQEGERE